MLQVLHHLPLSSFAFLGGFAGYMMLRGKVQVGDIRVRDPAFNFLLKLFDVRRRNVAEVEQYAHIRRNTILQRRQKSS